MTTWFPSDTDILWVKSFIANMADRSTWATPGTLTVWRIDKTAQTITLSGSLAGGLDNELNRRTKFIFEALGWLVIDGTKKDDCVPS